MSNKTRYELKIVQNKHKVWYPKNKYRTLCTNRTINGYQIANIYIILGEVERNSN